MDISPAGVSAPGLPRRTRVEQRPDPTGCSGDRCLRRSGGGYALVALLVARTDRSRSSHPSAAGSSTRWLPVWACYWSPCLRAPLSLRAPLPLAARPDPEPTGGRDGGDTSGPVPRGADCRPHARGHLLGVGAHRRGPPGDDCSDYRKAPPILPMGGTAAAPGARRAPAAPVRSGRGVVRRRTSQPVRDLRRTAGPAPERAQRLGQWRWTGTMWSPGNLVLEEPAAICTPAAARAYLATFGHQPKNVRPSDGPRLRHSASAPCWSTQHQEVGSIHLRSAASWWRREFSVTSSNTRLTSRDWSKLQCAEPPPGARRPAPPAARSGRPAAPDRSACRP